MVQAPHSIPSGFTHFLLPLPQGSPSPEVKGLMETLFFRAEYSSVSHSAYWLWVSVCVLSAAGENFSDAVPIVIEGSPLNKPPNKHCLL